MTFKIKMEVSLQLLKPETIKLLGITLITWKLLLNNLKIKWKKIKKGDNGPLSKMLK